MAQAQAFGERLDAHAPLFDDLEDRNNPDLRRLAALCGLGRRFVRGEGVWLTTADGRRFLDAYAQFGAVVLGHNAPEVHAVVKEALEARRPAMVQPYEAANAEALGRALRDAIPGRPRRCVVTTSGAEAVEAAIKLVRAASGRTTIVTALGSFHGRTLGALSATGQSHHREGFGPLAPGFETVPFGDPGALAARLDRGDVAAFFVEPVQGEGGVVVPPAGYLPEVRALCDRHRAALVVDEIQTGLGRTGPVFAVSGENVAPDVLLTAKGLGGGLFPLGACLVAEDWWTPRFALGHSSTFANNDVACAVGCAVLRKLGQPSADGSSLLERAEAVGRHLGERLRSLERSFPDVIGTVRGRGLLWGVEFVVPDDQASPIMGYLAHQGLFAYSLAGALAETASVLALPALGARHMLRVAPPLVVTREEVDRITDGLGALCTTLRTGRVAGLLRALGWTRGDALGEVPAGAGASRPWVTLPASPRSTGRSPGPASRRWAFLAHYTRPEDLAETDPALAALSAEETRSVLARAALLPPGVMIESRELRSGTGDVTAGWVIGIPWLPERLRARGARTLEAIAAAVDLAKGLGAHVLGLGGLTTPLSDRGRAVTGRGLVITTGNVLTAGMAVAALEREAQRRNLDLARARVGVVGARGSVGALAARLLARQRPLRLVLVGNPEGSIEALRGLASRISWRGGVAEACTWDALATCDVVLSASGAGRPVLDSVPWAPGTLLCDVARPADASAALRARGDLTVIDGGLVRLPDPEARFGPGNLQGLPPGVVLACLAESLLHALAGTAEDMGIGPEVPVEQVDRVMALADRHGFELWDAAAAGAGRLDTALATFLQAYAARPDLVAQQRGWSPTIELRATDSQASATVSFADGLPEKRLRAGAPPTLVVSADERTLCDVLDLKISPNEPYLFGELTVRGPEADFIRLDYIATAICPQ